MWRREAEAVGSKAWSLASQRNGIDCLKSPALGKTARHAARVELVSRARSAARRPWTVIVPMGLTMVFGTVRSVRRADVGTVRIVSPAWVCVRVELMDICGGERPWELGLK